jgi:hypothetical protein
MESLHQRSMSGARQGAHRVIAKLIGAPPGGGAKKLADEEYSRPSPCKPKRLDNVASLVRYAAATVLRRRHQARRPPLAKIRPGRPVPTMGPGTCATVYVVIPEPNSWKPI